MQLTPEEKEARQKVYRRRWYENNKEAILTRQKAYQKTIPVEKKRETQKRYRDRHPDRCRARYERKNWAKLGNPIPTRPRPDMCECCGQPCFKTLSLDHCHATGVFRGWLCAKCNLAIGKLGDTVESVQKALDYLKRSVQ